MDNETRANKAQKALDYFTGLDDGFRYKDEDTATRAGDLICDLLHLVYSESENPDNEPAGVLATAQMNFEAELQEESEFSCDGGCDGHFPYGKIRVLPSGGDSNLLLCFPLLPQRNALPEKPQP